MSNGMTKQVVSAAGSVAGYGLAKMFGANETATVLLSVAGGLVAYSAVDSVTKRTKTKKLKAA